MIEPVEKLDKYELSQWPDDGPSMEIEEDGSYYLASQADSAFSRKDARIATLESALQAIVLFGHGEGHGSGFTCANMAQRALDKQAKPCR